MASLVLKVRTALDEFLRNGFFTVSQKEVYDKSSAGEARNFAISPSRLQRNERNSYDLTSRQRNRSPPKSILSREYIAAIGNHHHHQRPDHLCSYRSQRRSCKGGPDDAAHGTACLRQPKIRHATYDRLPNPRNRSPFEGASLAGRRRSRLALL
jgi:hypothetical protein